MNTKPLPDNYYLVVPMIDFCDFFFFLVHIPCSFS